MMTENMTRIQQAVLALLGQALLDVPGTLPELTDEEWLEVLNECVAQTVSAIALDGAMKMKAPVPKPVLQAWRGDAMRNLVNFERIKSQQREMLQALGDIPCAILKGLGVAQYYPRPEMRSMGDIDYLVREKDFAQGMQRMEAIGYQLTAEDEKDLGIHANMQRPGEVIEQHRAIGALPNNAIGEKLLQIILDGLDMRREVQLEGETFHVLPLTGQGLVLLLHMISHMQGSGLGIRQWCDWVMFVDREMPNGLPEDFEKVLRESGLYRFAQVMTRAAQVFLGMPEEKAPWARDCEDSVSQAVLEDLFRAGNMGRKDTEYFKGRHLGAEKNDGKKVWAPVRIFRNLQARGVQYWAAAEKYPVLRCVAWMRPILHYVKRLCSGERTLKNIPAMLRGMKKGRALIEQLDLFKTEP